MVTKCEGDIRLGDVVNTWEAGVRIQNDLDQLEKWLEISTRKFSKDKWEAQALERQNQMPRQRGVNNSLGVSILGKELMTNWIGANTLMHGLLQRRKMTLCAVSTGCWASCSGRVCEALLLASSVQKGSTSQLKGDMDGHPHCCQEETKKFEQRSGKTGLVKKLKKFYLLSLEKRDLWEGIKADFRKV